MKLFHLYRAEDVSGVSGTGPVVEGVQFTNGWCALRWMTERSTVCFYQSLDDVKRIHGHEGRTELIVHDFEAANKGTIGDGSRMELYLQTLEEISAALNLADEPGATREDLDKVMRSARGFLGRLQTQLSRRLPARGAKKEAS